MPTLKTRQDKIKQGLNKQTEKKNTSRKYYFRTNCGSLLLSLLVSILFPTSAFADPLHSQMREFLEREVAIYAESIHSKEYRFDIKPVVSPTSCDKKINLSLSNSEKPMGRISITAECNGVIYWKTRAQAYIYIYVDLIVSSGNIDRNQKIREDQLSEKRALLTGRRLDYFTKKQFLVGNITKRKITAGTIFTKRMIETPLLIERNNMISIVAKSPTLNVSMPGLALENGRQGELIKVRNLSSGKIISGKVVSPQIVKTFFKKSI